MSTKSDVTPFLAGTVMQVLGDGPTAFGTWEVDNPVKEVVPARGFDH